jgi:nucleotide-binding universal stress UspA family protein
VETQIVNTLDAPHILEFARNHSVDLIILTNAGENISDSVHQMAAETSIPILILPERMAAEHTDSSIRYRNLLVPLDGSQRAECVLPYAMALAQSNESKLILAHVVRKPAMPSRSPLPREEMELLERITERNKLEATQYLEQLRNRFPAGTEARISTSDNVSTAIHEIIEQEGIDLVLLSAHGNSGEPQWPYGSETARLISYSRTPILLVQDMRVTTTTAAPLATDVPVREARGR